MASIESFTTIVAATDNNSMQPQLQQRRPLSTISASSSSLSLSSSTSSSSSSSSRGRPSLFKSSFLSSLNTLTQVRSHGNSPKSSSYSRHGRKPYLLKASRSALIGEEPEWSEDDYVVLGLAHCFEQEEGGKIQDLFLIEPVGASSLECMDNGGATSYLYVTATTLGKSLAYDLSVLPPEFSKGKFCEDFEFRLRCTARTWKRDHAMKNLMRLAPSDGSVRSDFNFSLVDKRIVNKVYEVTDADNIKQDLSIDVYGRKQDEAAASDESSAQVASLYNA